MKSKQMRIKTGSNLTVFILGIMIVLIGYTAWGMLTISYRAYIYETAGILLTYILAVLYIALIVMAGKAKKIVEIRQFKVVSCVGFAISILLLFRTTDSFVLIVPWVIAFGICVIYGMISDRGSFRYIFFIEFIKKNIGILLVITITSLLLYDADAIQARWDGLLYYLTCMDLDISSLSNLAVYGHIAQTYGMFNGIGNLIVGNTFVVMIGLNIFLMLSSILGFYMVLREIIPDRKESQYAIAAAAYAWSPFLLGMVYYHSLDFYCSCLFIWVLYAFYKHRWIYFSIFSLLFCFTKEPAIVVYAAMCAGVVLWDIADDKGYSFTKRLQRCFARKQYYLMVLPGILWLATYRILGPWSAGNGGFSIDIGYVLDKLKNLYVLNFNWLFALFAIAGSVWILVKEKEKRIFRFLLPIWCSQIAFTVFSCLFNTVNHPRYNDTNQVTLYLLAIVPLLYYCAKKKFNMIVGVLSFLCLVSSFVTCDPLTKSLYDKVDIGRTIMISTTGAPLGDGMIYNRQMLGFEKALGSALQDALRESDVIFFSTINNNAYAFDGMAEVGTIENHYMIEDEFWDDVNRRREARKEDSTREFQAYQLTDKVNWKELEQDISDGVNYIYIPEVCDLYSDYIREHYHILNESEYEHRGWVIRRISFAK